MHEDLMRYSAEQEAIVSEMTDAPKKEEEEPAEAEAEEEVEEEAAEEETEEAEPAEAAPEGEVAEGEVPAEGAQGETAEGEAPAEGEVQAEGPEPGELTQEERIRALEDKVNLLEGDLHGDAADKAKPTVLKGGKVSQMKLFAASKVRKNGFTVLKKALTVQDASEKTAATRAVKGSHSKLQQAPADTEILNSFF